MENVFAFYREFVRHELPWFCSPTRDNWSVTMQNGQSASHRYPLPVPFTLPAPPVTSPAGPSRNDKMHTQKKPSNNLTTTTPGKLKHGGTLCYCSVVVGRYSCCRVERGRYARVSAYRQLIDGGAKQTVALNKFRYHRQQHRQITRQHTMLMLLISPNGFVITDVGRIKKFKKTLDLLNIVIKSYCFFSHGGA